MDSVIQNCNGAYLTSELVLQSHVREAMTPSRHELNTWFAFADFANDEGVYAVFFELADDAVGVVAAGNDNEADTHVENAEHLGLVDVAQAPKPAEYRRDRPTTFTEEDTAARRQHARHVAFQPFASDVGQAAHHATLDRIVPQDVLDRSHVDACRLQQFLTDSAAQFWHEIADLQPGVIENYLAYQTVAVGVQSGTGQAEHHVAGLNGPAIDDVIALDNADAETGHVVIARLIEVRQNSRFATDQGTVCLHAAIADPLDQITRQGRISLGHRQVIEKK